MDRGINVSLVVQEEGDYIFVGSGVPHSGFNMRVNLASAVNYACTSWIPHGANHAHRAVQQNRELNFPVEKLLAHSFQRLPEGAWLLLDAERFRALAPETFDADVSFMIQFMLEYGIKMEEFASVQDRVRWGGERARALQRCRSH